MIKVRALGGIVFIHNTSLRAVWVQLLDSGEVLEEPNQRKDRPRRKPLPATYEPGGCYPLIC